MSEFRSKIGDDFSLFSISHFGIGIVPPGSYDCVFECRPSFPLEVIIGEESYEVSDRSTLRVVHERETSISEIVLDTRAKDLTSKKLYHDIGGVGDDHLFFIIVSGFEHIESHRTREISWVKIDDIVSSRLRYISDELFREVTVGVEYRESLPTAYVLTGHDREDR